MTLLSSEEPPVVPTNSTLRAMICPEAAQPLWDQGTVWKTMELEVVNFLIVYQNDTRNTQHQPRERWTRQYSIHVPWFSISVCSPPSR